jgi:ABC-type branched-subunit amino acid transport system ATPase component
MAEPSVLLLDEPSAGLAPKLADTVLREQVGGLAASGVGVLLVEQRALAALEVGTWSYVLAAGQCVLSCTPQELLARDDLGEVFLGHVGTDAAVTAGRANGALREAT